jgi:predicted N-acyltransferase
VIRQIACGGHHVLALVDSAASRARRAEGGAQGEHKMARALLPVSTHSAHWLAHPAFAKAVDEFLAQEGQNMAHYLEHLKERNPLKN